MACSRVRHLKDLLFVPTFHFQRVANLANSQRHKERLREDERLRRLRERSLSKNLSMSKHKVHVKESMRALRWQLRQRWKVRNQIFMLLRLEITTAALNLLLLSIPKMSKDLLNHPKVPSSEAKLDGNDSDLFITGVDSSSNTILWVRIGSRGCVKGLD